MSDNGEKADRPEGWPAFDFVSPQNQGKARSYSNS
jgi:hypothetical protein